MRRTGRMAWWGTTAGLAIGLFWGTSWAEDRDTYQSAAAAAKASKAKAEAEKKKASSWWWPWGGDSKPPEKSEKPEKKTTTKAEKPVSEEPKKAPPAPTTSGVVPLGQEGVSLIAQEQAKFLRRQQVCDRLREVSAEQGDPRLDKQADLLEQRAWFIYEQRTAQARLPTPLPTKSSLEVPRTAARKPVELDRTTDGRPVRSVTAQKTNTVDGGEE